jgi:hypothetical protein
MPSFAVNLTRATPAKSILWQRKIDAKRPELLHVWHTAEVYRPKMRLVAARAGIRRTGMTRIPRHALNGADRIEDTKLREYTT